MPIEPTSPNAVPGSELGQTPVESDGPVFASDVEPAAVSRLVGGEYGDGTTPEPEPKPEDKPEEPKPEDKPVDPAAEVPLEGGTQFSPDFTYKVKGQVRSLPDWAQAAVKDEASQGAVREIFEKAEGFDFVKEDRDSLQNWYEEVSPTLQQVNMLNNLLAQKNLPAFFKGVNLPMQDVLNFSLQYAQMTPEQRQQLESSSDQVFSNYQNEVQQTQHMSHMQNQLVQAREREVNLLLSRPDVSQVSQQLDQRFGRLGVLRQEIVTRGQYYAAQGLDKPAEELLNEVLSLAGMQGGGQPQVPAVQNNFQGGGGQPSPVGAGPAPQKPTMTNLRGSGRSPARKVLTSRKDLKARAAELEAQGR